MARKKRKPARVKRIRGRTYYFRNLEDQKYRADNIAKMVRDFSAGTATVVPFYDKWVVYETKAARGTPPRTAPLSRRGGPA